MSDTDDTPPAARTLPGAVGGTLSTVVGVVESLDHLGRGQGAVVEPDLVESTAEPLAPHGVATDPQRAGARRDRSRLGARGDLGRIDVQAHRGAVEGHREVAPGVEGQGRGRVGVHVGAADAQAAVGAPRRRAAAVERVGQTSRPLLEEHLVPRAGGARPRPRGQGPGGGQVEGVAVRHGHPVVDAVEAERSAVPAGGGPRRAALQGAVGARGRAVACGRAGPVVEAPGADETGRASGPTPR